MDNDQNSPTGPPEMDTAPSADVADVLATVAQSAPAGEGDDTGDVDDPTLRTPKKRRRGSRGGKNRRRPNADGSTDESDDEGDDDNDVGDIDDNDVDETDANSNASSAEPVAAPTPPPPVQPARARAPRQSAADARPELPERISEGRPSVEAANQALVRRPQIGDTRPAPPPPPGLAVVGSAGNTAEVVANTVTPRTRSKSKGAAFAPADDPDVAESSEGTKKKRRRSGSSGVKTLSAVAEPDELDEAAMEKRRGRERKGRPIGRYLMCVQVRPTLTQVAVLEGRNLIEHYVSRPADDISQIHGNIYLGKVQNVLPGMEAAFVDIGTPKNAVLYRGDVQYDAEDILEKTGQPRIEQMLRAKQLMICQVTKNPIGAKGARLTQEVSLPGRFVVLIPNSKTYGISKRLPDDVRKRLRNILDRVKPVNTPTLLYREPELAVRVIREEFNSEYRGIIIDDQRLHDDVRDYVQAFNPELADRVEFYDGDEEGLPLFERQHIHEQLHKALDRKVWLPSGGSLIIEHTEALTVIDVNTGKNVGTSNLEETVFRNNLEAAEEVAKQVRLRDIGGIVVIDFIDMEIRENRRKVVDSFRSALARDKTRTQVFDISELGLVEMTRKRIGEGLLTNFADQCPNCQGRGVLIDHALID
jgi:ribonuclease E